MSSRSAVCIHVHGVVQGVGFRPFVARLARRYRICGSVCNKGPFVEILAEGAPQDLSVFVQHLVEDAPERAAILKLEQKKISPAGVFSFRIVRSEKTRGDIFVSPDIATCRQCEQELFDPANRRYLHPFINCTACGPRVTILDGMPYDRARTSMKAFPMCPACAQEYSDPATRRYHAQPVCCNECGPELYLLKGGQARGTEALLYTRDVVRAGGIAAVKGIGGFHLCADAGNEEAVRRLRTLKNRPFKPFAVMMRDLETVRKNCIVSPEQEKILTGPGRPILLLPVNIASRLSGEICDLTAPDNPYLGVMLPYAPVQMLLFSYPDGKPMPPVLIMTSGNAKDTPICMNDAEADQFLSPLCDVILSNNREIRLRADDSVMNWLDGTPYMLRRSRGYAPLPVMITFDEKKEQGRKVLGIGGELKNAFCLAEKDRYYLSPYIGNLMDVRGADALQSAVLRMEELLEIAPDRIVCDLHPGYSSAAIAEQMADARGIPLFRIQHHYAHILSCMAENDRHEPVIGIAFDGTGYGTDGTIWGGEFLAAARDGFRRLGSLELFPQAGGDLAAREGWRIAAALLKDPAVHPERDAWEEGGMPAESSAEAQADFSGHMDGKTLAARLGVCSSAEYELIQAMIRKRVNIAESSSAGRVFDAASAVLGLRRCSTTEGEASMVLQFAAEQYERYLKEGGNKPDCIRHSRQDYMEDNLSDLLTVLARSVPIRIDEKTGQFRIPVRTLARALAMQRLKTIGRYHGSGESALARRSVQALAYGFHAAMAELMTRGAVLCREETGIQAVALSGGVMQNTLLLRLLIPLLEQEGFQVLHHHMVPANDGGIALGQAFYTGR